MRPVIVSAVVHATREEVHRFLDVLANHKRFTNHMLVDWSYAGPATGVGGGARMRVKLGRSDRIDSRAFVRRGDQRSLHRLAEQLRGSG